MIINNNFIVIKHYGDVLKSLPFGVLFFPRLFGFSSGSAAVAARKAACDPGTGLSASIAFDLGRDNHRDNRLIDNGDVT